MNIINSLLKKKNNDLENLLFARIVEHTPIGILITTPEGYVSYVNTCAEEMLKISRTKVLNTAVEQYFSKRENELGIGEILVRLFHLEKCDSRITIVAGNGNELVGQMNAFAITGAHHEPEAFIFMMRDVSRELAVDGQIENKNLEMAKINTELIRSNEEFKRISELKSNFLSIASHELKTPLTSIKGYSDIIIDTMKSKLDPDIFRMIESISRAADRLHRVVNNILDVTRIEQKRLRLRPEYMNLADVAKDCIADLSQFASQRSIGFDTDFHPLPQFFGDRARMQQTFTNLFSNALKYSPNNSTILVRIYRENEHELHCSITDQGIGIDRIEQKKIFDPFYEVAATNRHSTDSSKFMGGGTGLGLSIVKGIIDRHGGTIWVDSDGVTPGTFPGSTFHFTIPIESKISWDDNETKTLRSVAHAHNQIDGVSAEIPASGESVASVPVREDKPRILLIDSDRETIEIASMVLEQMFEISVAETGEAGIALAFEKLPSMILLDSYLPGIDGYRVCRILKSQEETRNIPIAFFSAGTHSDEIQKGFASGADDFLVKPFSGNELVDKIWRLLMKKKEEGAFKK